LRVAFVRLRETVRELRAYREAFLLLIAFLVYNDGIGTIIRMAAIYGAEIGIDTRSMITAILLVQFAGIPFTLLFGRIAQRTGPKRAILGGLAVYFVICAIAYQMRTTAHFYALALLVGAVQGGCQALSRSLYASMIPKHKSAELFGLYAVLDRFAGILGPLTFSAAIGWTGSSRLAILALVAFFGIGALLLARVDVERGRAAARAAGGALAA
jgi:UMF1 family MFS transporter